MNIKSIATFAALLAASIMANAQSVQELKVTCDSLKSALVKRTTVTSSVRLRKAERKGSTIALTFTQEFGNFPWRVGDAKWLKDTLPAMFPEKYKNVKVSAVYVDGTTLETFEMPFPGTDGEPVKTIYRTKDPRPVHPFIEEVGGQTFYKGLTGRNIALWQSHGRYYNENNDRWMWQRAPLFGTVEDMYTQTYVLPFLIPMLENAGAYVMTPRERDFQTNEVIADNDPSFTEGRSSGVRICGKYTESGAWDDAGTGFADTKAVYSKMDNPFLMGTARKASCHGKEDSKAVWTAEIPEKGMYSVYIAYKTLPNSTTAAHYTVNHLGGSDSFIVNQKMGGGTWIYLGTFEFDKGSKGNVTLDSAVPEGYGHEKNAVVTADAVRFGGGMSKIARGKKDADAAEYTTSGLPSFAEGAFYWMQWAGADSTLMKLHDDDYTSDYADRGAWVGWMSGGSRTNPKEEGLNIPIDMSLAFHTDAGTFQGDTIVGTLGIYTLLCNDSDKLPNGESRFQNRLYVDMVQSQITDDIRTIYDPEWNRRATTDKSYSESRTTTVPGMLLELLSHQNLGDMKFGLDPSFRFTVCRAIYKGMLKYLSGRYGCQYVVEPLPVNSFATEFKAAPVAGQSASLRLSWKATVDPQEETAMPTGFILYTKVDDKGYDNGMLLDELTEDKGTYSTDVNIQPGHVYSFKIVAYNDGGRSFPSEVLCAGVPKSGNEKSVLVVNNFTRVSAPAWYDNPEHAGFDSSLDGGVAYQQEIGFIGDQYQFRRELPWTNDDNPGFGACYSDQASKVFAGNTFDYTGIHGKAMMNCGYAFHSSSSAAFSADESLASSDFALDLICGKQVTTLAGNVNSPKKYTVFPLELQNSITEYTSNGGNILVSGANIGTDIWDRVFPVENDKEFTEASKKFAQSVLGYKWMTNYASRTGCIWSMNSKNVEVFAGTGRMQFYNEHNSKMYQVETPDGIVPAGSGAHTVLRYADTNISAATCFDAKNYKSVCIGFPIETIKSQDNINKMVSSVMQYFSAPSASTDKKKK